MAETNGNMDLFQEALKTFNSGSLGDAERLFKTFIGKQPNHVPSLNLLAIVLMKLGRYEDAEKYISKAVLLDQTSDVAFYNFGLISRELNKLPQAVEQFSKALELNRSVPETWNNRGTIFNNLEQYEKAIYDFDQAIALNGNYADAFANKGKALTALKRHDEASAAYDQALIRNAVLPYVEGARLHSKMHLCSWTDHDADSAHLVSSIKGSIPTDPFTILGIPCLPEEQLLCAKIHNRTRFSSSGKPIWQGERYKHDRIRVAYLSADFRDHPVSYLLAGVFEQHARERFETIAISFGPDTPSEMLTRLACSFDRFIDVKDRSDADTAKLIRELETDIAVDLMGYTAGSRTPIFAYRPSPIQVNYLGYPGTMGANFMDYLIADSVSIPVQHQKHYSEKISYLPNSFLPNDSKRLISSREFDRAEMGLPQTGFVFCCFNNGYKLTPGIFRCWINILKQVEGSVLWLSDINSIAVANLKVEASRKGVNPDRLVFAKRMPLVSDHLARHGLADLCLDTLPYNAHTTASDALWAGVPVLTQIGETFAGRVAASLLSAVGLPELITTTQQEYEDLAIELATNPGKLAAVKRRLADNRLTMPLFNTQLYTKHIEAAYTQMYERHQAGLPPEHIYVPQ